MFFVVVGTHTEHVINEFALDARINILICQCHTVTNGTDLRRSPHLQCRHQFSSISSNFIHFFHFYPFSSTIIHFHLFIHFYLLILLIFNHVNRVTSVNSLSCWVFQPVGRWFSSQDNKRSLDGFCVSLCPIKTE